jgi:hypothetical protein
MSYRTDPAASVGPAISGRSGSDVEEARELAMRNPHRRIGPVVAQPVLPYGA